MNKGTPSRLGALAVTAAILALALFLVFDRISGPASADTTTVDARAAATPVAPGPAMSAKEAIAKVEAQHKRGRERRARLERQDRRAQTARHKPRAQRHVEPALRYGSRKPAPKGWVQSGPGATPARNLVAESVAAFRTSSCVHTSACPGGRPIAVNTAEKRADFLRSLIDDRVTRLLLWIAERHRIVVMSARGSHSQYVQDGSGRRVESNHFLGRAADISAVDGVACLNETKGRSFDGSYDNPAPSAPGPCTRLADEINKAPGGIAPTETIFYFSIGRPSGVSLENHNDHVHVGFDAF